MGKANTTWLAWFGKACYNLQEAQVYYKERGRSSPRVTNKRRIVPLNAASEAFDLFNRLLVPFAIDARGEKREIRLQDGDGS